MSGVKASGVRVPLSPPVKLAQLVEQWSPKPKVVGSSPIFGAAVGNHRPGGLRASPRGNEANSRVVNHLGGWRSGVEQQVKIGKEESCLVLPITPYSMACSSAVERLTVNQVVASSILAGPVATSVALSVLDSGVVWFAR